MDSMGLERSRHTRLNRWLGHRSLAAILLLASATLLFLTPARGQDATPAATQPSTTQPSTQPAAQAAPASGIQSAQDRSKAAWSDPIVRADVEFSANRTSNWNEGEARYLFLEGDASIVMGTYGFKADNIVVCIQPDHQPGRLINYYSMYLENARPFAGKGVVTMSSPRLLVTCASTGDVKLSTNLLKEEDQSGRPFVGDAKARINRYLEATDRKPESLPELPPLFTKEMEATRAARRGAITGDMETMAKPGSPAPPAAPGSPTPSAPAPGPLTRSPPGVLPVSTPSSNAAVPSAAPSPAASPIASGPTSYPASSQPSGGETTAERNMILPGSGDVFFDFDKIVYEKTPAGATVVVLIGHVRLIYSDRKSGINATLTSENAVVFFDGDPIRKMSNRKAKAADVQGIYLEDNVIITYSDFTIRGPRVYYDLQRNKAAILSAVMFAYDPKRKIPIYVRAEDLRQESREQFVATNSVMSTSEFAEPHFSIASDKVTFRTETKPDGVISRPFSSEGNVVEARGIPIFAWPYFSGDAANQVPLKGTGFSYSSSRGLVATSSWDVFGVSGVQRPEGVDATAHFDVQGIHGFGTGIDSGYEEYDMFGNLNTYILPDDDSHDDVGRETSPDFHDSTRGFAHWQHRQNLGDNWTASGEFAYVSDPTFLETFENSEASLSKQYETSLYVKKQEEDWAFTFLTKYDLNSFVTQTTTLQTPGYTVDKLPELGYYREGTDILGDHFTYYAENTAGMLRIRPGTNTPASLGFGDTTSLKYLGIPNANTPFNDALFSEGFPDNDVLRIDSRHEVDAPLELGIFNVTPYVAGRFTGYNENFSQYNGGQDDQSTRFWGTVGSRFSTSFSKSYDEVENNTFDLHRIRHVIEPNAVVWDAGSTLGSENLPIFDPDVEGIRDSQGGMFGVRNTLETQRGGEGRERSVDWIVMNTDFIHQNAQNATDTMLGKFLFYRPEYSYGGDFFFNDMAMQLSDNLGANGDVDYDLNAHDLAQWRVGATMQHSPILSSFVDYTEINPLNAKLISYGFTYVMTRKYSVSLSHTIDLAKGNTSSIQTSLTRRLPRWRLVVGTGYNVNTGETVVGAYLIPDGLSAGGILTQAFSSSNTSNR